MLSALSNGGMTGYVVIFFFQEKVAALYQKRHFLSLAWIKMCKL